VHLLQKKDRDVFFVGESRAPVEKILLRRWGSSRMLAMSIEQEVATRVVTEAQDSDALVFAAFYSSDDKNYRPLFKCRWHPRRPSVVEFFCSLVGEGYLHPIFIKSRAGLEAVVAPPEECRVSLDYHWVLLAGVDDSRCTPYVETGYSGPCYTFYTSRFPSLIDMGHCRLGRRYDENNDEIEMDYESEGKAVNEDLRELARYVWDVMVGPK
jgi:hypothetical protein